MSDRSIENTPTSSRPGVGPGAFKSALGRFATGVCVITAVGSGGTAVGITVSAFASLSLEPPLILFCLDKSTTRLAAFKESGEFGISVLSSTQASIADLFAGQSPNKFDSTPYRTGSNGCPLITDAIAQLECSLVAANEGGDHIVFVAQVDATSVDDGSPLLYYRGAYGRLGASL